MGKVMCVQWHRMWQALLQQRCESSELQPRVWWDARLSCRYTYSSITDNLVLHMLNGSAALQMMVHEVTHLKIDTRSRTTCHWSPVQITSCLLTHTP